LLREGADLDTPEANAFGNTSPSYPLAQSPSSLLLFGPFPALDLGFAPPPSFFGVSLLARFAAFAGSSTDFSTARFFPPVSLAAFAVGIVVRVTASAGGGDAPAIRALFLLPAVGAEDFASARGAAEAFFLGADPGKATDFGGDLAAAALSFEFDLRPVGLFSTLGRFSALEVPLFPIPAFALSRR
jgi:hypothetical protein